MSNSSEIKFVPKGWGHEKWIVNKPEYCGKLLFFKNGKRCSWHYHKIKDETFYVQSGELLLMYGEDDDINKGKIMVMRPGDTFHVYPGLRHQMQARIDTELFEFSTLITLHSSSIEFKHLLIFFSLLNEVISIVISFIDII